MLNKHVERHVFFLSFLSLCLRALTAIFFLLHAGSAPNSAWSLTERTPQIQDAEVSLTAASAVPAAAAVVTMIRGLELKVALRVGCRFNLRNINRCEYLPAPPAVWYVKSRHYSLGLLVVLSLFLSSSNAHVC